jgi:dTDP-D-glucose 4,6-dehydratase
MKKCGFKREYSLQQGIEETIKYYEEIQRWIN